MCVSDGLMMTAAIALVWATAVVALEKQVMVIVARSRGMVTKQLHCTTSCTYLQVLFVRWHLIGRVNRAVFALP